MQKFIAIICLVGATIVVLGSVREQGFVWDDKKLVLENQLTNPATFSGTVDAWTHTDASGYTPIPSTIWNATTRLLADSLPAKPQANVLHATNLAFHILNVVLVFLILCYFIDSIMAAMCGALVFSLHPLQVEPVAWISAAPLVMGGFFSLFAIWQYLGHARAKENSRSHRAKSNIRIYLATLSFVAAMLCSPAMIVAPLLAYLLESLLPRSNTLTRTQKSSLPVITWLVLGTPLVFLAVSHQDTGALSQQVSIWTRPLIAGDALSFYLYKLFAPIGMAPDYGRSPHFVLGHWWGYLSWMAPVFLALVLMFWQHKVRGLFAGAAGLFFIALLPFLGLIAFESQSMSTVADRYAYLAMLGPALALAHLMSIPRKVVLPFLGLVALVAFGLLSHGQLDHWQSDETLWTKSLSTDGASPQAHQVMGDRAWEAGNWQVAREHYEKVLSANNTNPDIHFYLAEIARREGRNTSAVDLYNRVLELNPDYGKAYESFAMVLQAESEMERAKTYFEKALSLDPNAAISRFELGKTLVALGDEKAAMEEFSKSLRSTLILGDTRAAEAHALLGQYLNRTGEQIKAREHLESALKLVDSDLKSHRILADIYYESEDLEKARIHYEKAKSAYATDPILFVHLGRTQMDAKAYKEASENFERAIELDPEDAKAVLNVAVAFFNLRRFGDAKEKFNEALSINKNLPDAHYYLGDMERWAGKIERALGHYYLALKIDEHHPQSHYRLGNYFMDKNKVRQAIWHYRSALKRDPEDKRILGRLNSAERKL